MAIFAGIGRIAGRDRVFVNTDDGKCSEFSLSGFRRLYGKGAKGIATGTVIHPIVPDIGTSASKIPTELKTRIETWMREHMKKFDYGRAFDLAVDAAHDLRLTDGTVAWEIPVYVVEIAESIMGPDDEKAAES